MKIVLLSGGSGKRLWPLSNDARPKQFLKVLHNEEGRLESMVQRVWRQLAAAELADDAFVAVGVRQAELIRSQLGSRVPVIMEPSRRDTFPAIALAAAYLHSIAGVSPRETIAVLPVDPYVEPSFYGQLRRLEGVLAESGAELALIGARPTYSSGKYGYIVPAAEGRDVGAYRKAGRFVEKPDEATAEQLIAEGALWNCGVFAFRLGTMLELLRQRCWPTDYVELSKRYDRLPAISFDYEVAEKCGSIAVARYDGFWKDLGTWNTLTEEMHVDRIGRSLVCDRSVNTHVVNELDTLITVVGLSDVVVAASPDGILVADKSSTPRLKEMMHAFDQRPMFEEKRWGSARVTDNRKLSDGREVLTRTVRVRAGESISYHLHLNHDEYWTITNGAGELVMNDEIAPIGAGDTRRIPAGTPHSVRATEDLEWIEVQLGARLETDDVIRLCHDWDDVVRLSRDWRVAE